jgi:hypothetical protein
MKKLVYLFLFVLELVSCTKIEVAESTNESLQQRVSTSVKKGVGLTESTFGAVQLDSLGVSWYYSWGPTTGITTTKTFVPMCFSLNTLPRLTTYTTLLGYNEPDNTSQSNISVSSALSNWPTLVSKSTKLGSPAMAGNPLTSGSWLQQFMVTNPKVDFICIHWYKGVNSTLFINDMKAIIAKWKKPIWITEFAPQTVSSSTSSPNKYTQAQVNAFITAVVKWMESEPMVEKYAWHNSKTGTSAIFTTSGQLTPTGIVYRDAK